MKKPMSVEIYSDDVISPPTTIKMNGSKITETDVMDAVDKLLTKLNETNSMQEVDNALDSLIAMQHIAGKSLAKLLWGTKKWWDATGQGDKTGDTFDDRMHAIHGLNRTVVGRYVMLWESYDRDVLPESIRDRPLKDQIAIAKTLEQDYQITNKEWKKLETAANNGEVLDILRGVKGKSRRKNSINITEERNGDVIAWDVDGGRHILGWFNSAEENDDPIIKKGLARLRGDQVKRR